MLPGLSRQFALAWKLELVLQCPRHPCWRLGLDAVGMSRLSCSCRDALFTVAWPSTNKSPDPPSLLQGSTIKQARSKVVIEVATVDRLFDHNPTLNCRGPGSNPMLCAMESHETTFWLAVGGSSRTKLELSKFSSRKTSCVGFAQIFSVFSSECTQSAREIAPRCLKTTTWSSAKETTKTIESYCCGCCVSGPS